jgi:hypothetical protein
MCAKSRDDGLILGNLRVSYAKPLHKGVWVVLGHRISEQRPRLDLAERART